MVVLMKIQTLRVMTPCQLVNFTDDLADLAACIIVVQVDQELRALTTLMTT